MDFGYDEDASKIQDLLKRFMKQHVLPASTRWTFWSR